MAEISLTNNIGIIFIFLEGFFSFFSPCVLPLIPVYISYLAGNGKRTGLDGIVIYDKKIVFVNTLFFILGISSVFLTLGLSFSALGIFLNQKKVLFSRIGGIIIIIMGLSQLNLIKLNFLNVEKRIQLELNMEKMNFIIAYIMGFTFSFAWTPCIGPALSSILILASNADNIFSGNILVLIYTLGFILPFIILGVFTTETLNFFREKKNMVRYTIKAGGIILIVIGIAAFTGKFAAISRLLL